MSMTETLGYISAFLTTFAFVPQAYHSWKTRDLSGVSLPMYSIFSLGVAGWIVYGYQIQSWPVFLANCVTFVLSCMVLYLKLKHR
jgi:MtN3 and saliva related transmembrane protein